MINYRKVIKYADSMTHRYGVTRFTIDKDHDHPQAICEMVSGNTVVVSNLPNSSGTEDSHVAQNFLKYARLRDRLAISNGESGTLGVSYKGGCA
jgi:hypothetical protein